MTYYIYGSNGAADSSEDTVYTGDANLRSQFLLNRSYYFLDVLGVRAAIEAIGSWGTLYDGKLNHQDLGSATGFGSTALLVPVWLINQSESARYFVIAPYVWFPSGQYNPDNPLNVAENRWKGTLQAGFHQGFGSFMLELAADATVYGDNPDFGPNHQRLANTPTYELQAWLRYDWDKKFHCEAGFSQLLGGLETINGMEDGFRTERSRVRFGGGYWITPKIEIIDEIASDVAVRGGFKADIVNMARVNVVF
jgi:hypothetical protein